MQDLCPLCAGQLGPGVRKCRHCGEWLPEQGDGAKPRDELAGTVNRYLLKAPKVIAISVIVSVVIFAIGTALIFNWYSTKSEQMQRDFHQ